MMDHMDNVHTLRNTYRADEVVLACQSFHVRTLG